MRSVRDTFLHYLADNLSGINVRNLRRDSTNPALSDIETNAVNVQFITDGPDVNVGYVVANIDAAHEEELSAVDLSMSVWRLLSASGMTPQLDYTVPASPQPLGSNIFWDIKSVVFRPVHSDLYFRKSCTLLIRYHPI